ncbi:anaphase-promoting complex subunit 10-like [Oppia nitens]|uniref:anaphase-promoting complex subunit 10-like n=1 Tax=Oppia nitens TaxID=1686743 RepID=UPI0023D9F9D6|nr:anaphase-promoting complex subunit 10-like [Oppia nitens]
MPNQSTNGPSGRPKPECDPIKDEKMGLMREVGGQAVWSLSSCKPGFGVDQLRDNCLETYWQSDGPQPHLVNIQFRRKTTIQDVCIYADYKLDESYTPNRISVRAGNHFHDLQEVELMDLSEPNGWVVIPLKDSNDSPIRAFLIQIAVLSNHQNGRDTHIRQIKVHSPVQNSIVSVLDFPINFTTVQMAQHSTIR